MQGGRIRSGMAGDASGRMFTVAKELLWRQRQIHQFPCNKEEVLVSLLPVGMQDNLIATDTSVEIYWGNLTHCVMTDRAVIVELDGETGKAFWMRFDKKVPSPGPGTAFMMPHDNIHHGTIDNWWHKANEIHAELTEYQTALWDFLQRADHPQLVEKYWRELHPFVDFHVLTSHHQPDLNRRRLMPLPSQEHRDGIIETLAASTLLPKHTCDAWVDYEAEDS